MRELNVSFQGHKRELDAYLVIPDQQGRLPAIIVVPEVWGLDDHIRGVARRFAGQGYVALAPDLYTGELHDAMAPDKIMAGMVFLRQASPEVQRDPSRLEAALADRSPEERRSLVTLMRVMSPAQRAEFADDLTGAVSYLIGRAEVDAQQVSCLGFCMGGGLSARLATLSPELHACIIFYGENPPLDAVPAIQARVLGFYGGDDARITDTVPQLAEAMSRAGKSFEYHIYPGAPHAFFNDTRPSHRPDAATDAWNRTIAFLAAAS